MNDFQTPECLTIDALNRLLSAVLEESCPQLIFEGEIAELSRPTSGHLYITLKDELAEARIILWASAARVLKFVPAKGMSVRCYGRPNVYNKTGALRIIVARMEPTGAGALQKKFQELKDRLEREGLFDPARKRQLPFLPKAIGLVTSAQGAALHDIMVRLRERMPQIPVYLVDVRVQGEGAKEEIAAAIDYLGASGLVDVIIAGRGGGSLEDRWAFNEELVVRAFFACRVPIISAVGHEVDISLSDLAADARAPTPTAAAEIVVPRRSELLEQIADLEERLHDYESWLNPLGEAIDSLVRILEGQLEANLKQARLSLQAGEAQLKRIEPARLIEIRRGQIATHEQRLQGVFRNSLSARGHSVLRLEGALKAFSVSQRLKAEGDRIVNFDERLKRALAQKMEGSSARLKSFSDQLSALSPQRVLERGFAVVRGKSGVVRSASDLALDDQISVTLARGSVGARVNEVKGA